MNSRSNPDARKPAPSNSMPQPNNVNNFSNMNDQSRAFIQASFAPNFSSNAQLNDQSRAFIQSSFIPQSHNVSSSQNNANAFSSKLKVSGSVDPNTEHIKTLKYDDDDPLADQMVVKLENTSPNVDELTHLSMRMKRKNLQSSSFNEQTLPFVVSLAVDDLKSVNKVPIDLVCVIDHSGSMNGEKIQLVRNTFNYLLKYLNDADRLSIVIFDDKASRHIPFLKTTEFNKKRIMSAVRNIQGGGGTDINLGIMHAFQVLQQRRYINPMTSIFLLSDGLDGGAQKKVQASLNAFNIQEDVTINTFGFGNDHDPQLMTDIANLRDGNFYFIEKLDTIDEAFVDCLGGLQSSVAQNVQINIKAEQSEFLQGVQIAKAHGDLSMWNFDNGAYITKMATLMSGKQKDYVLEIKIPTNPKQLLDHQKNITIATAEAIITGLDNKVTVKKADLTITLFNEIEEFKDEEEEDDREVMKNFYRVKGASLMDEARQLADNKRNEDAKKLLQNFKEEVQNSYLKNEEFIKNLIKDIDQAIKDFNPVIYQEVGRHNIYNNQRAQMHQRSALNSNNCYQNEYQVRMTNEVRAMKSKKPF